MSRRVLVVDDDDNIREVAQVSLEAVAGWKVLAASSGHEGVEKAIAEGPEAILLDVMMPDMDGPTTFEKLLADGATCDIPVVFLTAKIQASDRARLTQLGARGVIAKPFDPMGLAEQIAALLDWQ